jgi:5-methylcytosine-specific restriction endonuclease McrA
MAAPKVALPFYRTAEWKALVAKLITVRGRKCEDCSALGCRIYADHVVELRDGGAALDERNIRLRCAKCHGAKTELERKKRAGLA